MGLTNAKELRKKVLNSITGLLVLQLLTGVPLPKNKIAPKLNSKFDVWLHPHPIYSALSYLKKEGLILNNPEKITLTKKGECLRQELVGEYLKLQRIIELHLR